jgi:hypothetical protein
MLPCCQPSLHQLLQQPVLQQGCLLPHAHDAPAHVLEVFGQHVVLCTGLQETLQQQHQMFLIHDITHMS